MNNSLPSNWFLMSDLEKAIACFEQRIANLQERLDKGYASNQERSIELIEKYKAQIDAWKSELAEL